VRPKPLPVTLSVRSAPALHWSLSDAKFRTDCRRSETGKFSGEWDFSDLFRRAKKPLFGFFRPAVGAKGTSLSDPFIRTLAGGQEVTSGFSGTFSDDRAEAFGTSLMGTRSLSFHATLKRLADT